MNFDIEYQQLKQTLATYFGVPLYQHEAGPEGVWVGSIMDDLKNMGLMLAGGTITSLFTGRPVNDLDFYIFDIRRLPEAQAYFKRVFHNAEKEPFMSINATTYKRKSGKSNKVWTIQLIGNDRFYGTPDQVMAWFDFTITQGVFWFLDECFYFGKRFFVDNAKQKLVYLGASKYPICAMHRLKKYQDRGYKCPGSTIMHISLAIVQLEIKTYKDLKEQLMGIDTSYLQNLLGEDRYNDNLPVDYGQFIQEALDSINGFPLEDELEALPRVEGN